MLRPNSDRGRDTRVEKMGKNRNAFLLPPGSHKIAGPHLQFKGLCKRVVFVKYLHAGAATARIGLAAVMSSICKGCFDCLYRDHTDFWRPCFNGRSLTAAFFLFCKLRWYTHRKDTAKRETEKEKEVSGASGACKSAEDRETIYHALESS